MRKLLKPNVGRIHRGCSIYDSSQNAPETKHKDPNVNINISKNNSFIFTENNYNLLDQIDKKNIYFKGFDVGHVLSS